VFSLIGIANPEIIVAEGVQIGPEQREKALEGALTAATNLRAA
jgi:FMN-dependent NADH-azoreductase